YQQNGSGTFQTGTGAVSLRGDTTITSGNTLTVAGTGATTLGGALSVGGNTTITGTSTLTGAVTVSTLGATNTATMLCRNSTNQLAGCSTTGTGAIFVQGGNSFGATAELGTNDNYGLNLETNGIA